MTEAMVIDTNGMGTGSALQTGDRSGGDIRPAGFCASPAPERPASMRRAIAIAQGQEAKGSQLRPATFGVKALAARGRPAYSGNWNRGIKTEIQVGTYDAKYKIAPDRIAFSFSRPCFGRMRRRRR
jgi:hypothetical protein